MIRTLIAEVVEPLGAVHQRQLVQPPLERVGPLDYRRPPARMRDHYWMLRPLDVRRHQRSWIAVKLGHDGPAIGHVAHLELAVNGSLWMAAEVAASDDELDGLRCSPRWRSDFEGRHATVEHVGLVAEPGQPFVQPITVLAGRLSPTNLRRWRVPTHLAGLVERAVAVAASSHTERPIVVHDADEQRGERRDDAHARERAMIGDELARLGVQSRSVRDDDAPLGELRFGPPGRILRVT